LPTDVLLVCLFCWRREPQRTKREHLLCRGLFGALQGTGFSSWEF
jgi:hypothetical protein